MGIWKKRLGSWARWWNTEIKVNPTQVSAHLGHPVEHTVLAHGFPLWWSWQPFYWLLLAIFRKASPVLGSWLHFGLQSFQFKCPVFRSNWCRQCKWFDWMSTTATIGRLRHLSPIMFRNPRIPCPTTDLILLKMKRSSKFRHRGQSQFIRRFEKSQVPLVQIQRSRLRFRCGRFHPPPQPKMDRQSGWAWDL